MINEIIHLSESQSLSQIFQSKLFKISHYHRVYAWQGQQLIDFWGNIDNYKQAGITMLVYYLLKISVIMSIQDLEMIHGC